LRPSLQGLARFLRRTGRFGFRDAKTR
jgi:hypothetical protein